MICLLCVFHILFLFLCMCSCVFYKMKLSYTYSRSSDNILFNFISLKLMRKKNDSRPGPLSVWFAGSPHVCVGVLGDSGVLPRPKAVHVSEMVCLHCPRLSEWGSVWCALWWEGVLSRVGSLLTPWAAKRSSSHPWPWTGISRLENHSLTCFYSFFLNICIAHIYFNVRY